MPGESRLRENCTSGSEGRAEAAAHSRHLPRPDTGRRGNARLSAPGRVPAGKGRRSRSKKRRVQLSLPIATAENPKGATRRRTRDRLGAIRAGAPKAISKTGTAAPATMEEVADRLTDALLKVASNKGAPGPDGQTIEALADQWPVLLPRLQDFSTRRGCCQRWEIQCGTPPIF